MTTNLGLLWEGVTPAEVLGYYPQLVIDDVHACTRRDDIRPVPASRGTAAENAYARVASG